MYKKKNTNSFILIIIGVVVAILMVACGSDENNPTVSTSESDLIGVWEINSLSWITSYESGRYSQTQLDSLGILLGFNIKC